MTFAIGFFSVYLTGWVAAVVILIRGFIREADVFTLRDLMAVIFVCLIWPVILGYYVEKRFDLWKKSLGNVVLWRRKP